MRAISSQSRSLLAPICRRPECARQQYRSPLREFSSSDRKGATTPQQRAAFRSAEERIQQARAIEKNRHRKWKPGDVYAPRDLGPAEQKKWKQRQSPNTDVFDSLSLDPTSLYKNFSIMSEYVTDMGRIKHSKVTGLRWVNQRKVAKAIRRAIGLGIMPSTHRHPEILKKEAVERIRTRGAL